LKTFLLLLTFSAMAIAQVIPPIGIHYVGITWTEAAPVSPQPAATGFVLERATVSGGPYTTIATLATATPTAFNDISATGNVLIEGQKYCYVISATGPGGTQSARSTETCATIPFLPPVPTGPSSKGN
jgi:hypothetical protein